MNTPETIAAPQEGGHHDEHDMIINNEQPAAQPVHTPPQSDDEQEHNADSDDVSTLTHPEAQSPRHGHHAGQPAEGMEITEGDGAPTFFDARDGDILAETPDSDTGTTEQQILILRRSA